jgi:predicted signal transduction protein with EAL and GGDEF domain
LTGCLRACDSVSRPFANSTFARLGGDEFTILLNGIKDASEALTVADRIQTALLPPFNLSGHEVFTSASIGIAQSGPEYTRPDELLRDADTAMYRAKEQGRARCEIFDPIMRDRAVARLELETELRQAIEREEFRLHYQPIVSLVTNRPVGFEALIRWQHPRQGLIGPDQFLNVAEETEMILPIGRWVLNEACRQMRVWHTRWPVTPPLSVSVNVSGKQLIEAGFVNHVRACLLTTGLEPRDLKLEITESAIMTDPDTAASQLDRLRSLGVGVSLDDFGTGYSSLSYLRQFPIDTLKIDRSFLQQATSDDKGTEIVRAIVTLAHSLSMDLVAEGVEELQQVDRMRSLGCENCQGYYFSRPLNVEDAGRYLADVSQCIAPADRTAVHSQFPCQPASLAFQRQVDAIPCP